MEQESSQELYRFARFLMENANMKIEVSGHTDNVGKPEDNLVLSRRRATEVAKFLVMAGCNPDNIVIEGWGATRPLAREPGRPARTDRRGGDRGAAVAVVGTPPDHRRDARASARRPHAFERQGDPSGGRVRRHAVGSEVALGVVGAHR